MYFLIDLCCRSFTSWADAAPQAGGSSAVPTAALNPEAAPAAAAAAAAAAAESEPHAPAAATDAEAASPDSTAAMLQAAMHKKPCRACTTATDMFAAAFKQSQLQHRASIAHSPKQASSSSSSSSTAPTDAPSFAAAGALAAAVAGAAASAAAADSQEEKALEMRSSDQQQEQQQQSSSGGPDTTHQQQQQQQQAGSPPEQQQQQQQEQQQVGSRPDQQQQDEKQPFWLYEDEMPCPPDILELGRSTWTLLHSMAAYYPDAPTPQQQQSMHAFIAALGDFYPCQECAGHLQKELLKHPPVVSSAEGLSDWACRLHNLVNVRLGKPEFDCSKVFERWRDGPADDEACPTGH